MDAAKRLKITHYRIQSYFPHFSQINFKTRSHYNYYTALGFQTCLFAAQCGLYLLTPDFSRFQ